MSKKYVRIWEKFHNTKVPEGYEIHHIDGNHKNNSIENLQCVSIEEHLQIHLRQNNYGAAQAILLRMQRTEENCNMIKLCASMHQKQLILEGKHNFQKISLDQKKEISKNAGNYTLAKKIGIHAINDNPELARKNGKYGRSKVSREKELQMMAQWREKIKNSVWWNNGIINKRSKEQPGINFIKGMLKK